MKFQAKMHPGGMLDASYSNICQHMKIEDNEILQQTEVAPNRTRGKRKLFCFYMRRTIDGPYPVSSEISDLSHFLSYIASQSNGIKFGDNFFDVYCVN